MALTRKNQILLGVVKEKTKIDIFNRNIHANFLNNN